MANGIKITKETFQSLTTDAQRVALFQAVERIEAKLDNRKWKDKGIAGGSGLVGGFLAVIGSKLFSP